MAADAFVTRELVYGDISGSNVAGNARSTALECELAVMTSSVVKVRLRGTGEVVIRILAFLFTSRTLSTDR
jgi:hypothetical protein